MENNEKSRDAILAAAMLAPEDPVCRPLSAGSLTALALLGSPFATLTPDASVHVYHVCEFAWLHRAPLAEVRALLAREQGRTPDVVAAVLAWADDAPPEQVLRWREDALAACQAVALALTQTTDSSPVKNTAGPVSPSA